jgi:SAM-dependent methyltransferase
VTPGTATCTACGGAVRLPDHIRFRKDGFDVARCPSCGLMFRTSLPTEADIEAVYGGSYFCSGLGDTGGQGYENYVGEAAFHRESARARLDLLAQFGSPGHLLDVGAAAGFFVAEARKQGWEARGIDISAEMAEWARTNLQAPVDRATLASLAGEPASLAAVTMWDYIEHAVDPRGDLSRAYEILEPGGVMALSTGDAGSLAARLSGRRWHLLTPRHHNFYFTVGSLRRLLDDLGFDVVYCRHPGARYSLRYLAYKLRTMLDVAPVRAAATAVERSRLGSVSVPVNLGDIVTLVARRPDLAAAPRR